MMNIPRGEPDEGAAASAAEPAISLRKRFFNLHTLVSFLVAFAIIYFLLARLNIDLGETWLKIKTADPMLYLAGFAVYYLSFPLRGVRWRLLLQNVGFVREQGVRLPSMLGLVEIIYLSWFANCLVPAKLGDAYRGYLLKHNTGVSLSKTFGTILAERIIDMLVLFVLMLLAGLSIFHGTIPAAAVSLFVGGGVLAVAVVVGLLVMRSFGRVVERLLPQRLRGTYGRFEQGTLLSFQQLPWLGLLTLAIWLCEGGRLWLITRALGLTNLNLGVVLFIALAGSLLTTLPITPAGLGVVESAIITILLLASRLGVASGIDDSGAASVAILDRTVSYWSLIVLGLLLFIFTKKK